MWNYLVYFGVFEVNLYHTTPLIKFLLGIKNYNDKKMVKQNNFKNVNSFLNK